MTEQYVPISHDIDFIRKMDFLVEEFPNLKQKDVKEFWDKYRGQVYRSYRNSSNWISFYNIIADIIEEYTADD